MVLYRAATPLKIFPEVDGDSPDVLRGWWVCLGQGCQTRAVTKLGESPISVTECPRLISSVGNLLHVAETYLTCFPRFHVSGLSHNWAVAALEGFRMKSLILKRSAEKGPQNVSPSSQYPHILSETGRIRFRRVRFQTPNSVSFLALTELRGANSASSSQSLFPCQSELTEFFSELTEFGAELSEFSLRKQYSRNSMPPVSHTSREGRRLMMCEEDSEEITTHTVVVSGLTPGKEFLLRAWVANELGFNSEAPAAVQCHTARRPPRPEALTVEVVGPHAFILTWVSEEPPEASVQHCDVQVKEECLLYAIADKTQ